MLGIPWTLWGLVCLGVAAGFLAASVGRRRPGDGWLLRWAHGTVWILLAGSCLVRVVDAATLEAAANAIGLLALLLYLMFVRKLLRYRQGR